jgi:hypothetical protein
MERGGNVDQQAVLTRDELRAVLRVGRHTADRIAREIGIRISPRRIVIPRAALERYLERASGGNAA